MCDLYTKIWARFKAKSALEIHSFSALSVTHFVSKAYIKYHVPILKKNNNVNDNVDK